MLGVTFAGAPLSAIIAVSGTIPLLAGIGCAIAARARRLPFSFRRSAVSRERMRELGSLAGYVSLTEAAGTLIYALDRAILGLFKSAATVGLYEGPVRAHNLLRALNAATTVTVLPTASRYVADIRSRFDNVVTLPTDDLVVGDPRCCCSATAGGRPSISSTSGTAIW